MVPVTFSPKFRPDTISQFLEEKKEFERMEAMLSPVAPVPWMDPGQRGPVSFDEWLGGEDPVTGQRSNWQSYANEMVGKAGGGQYRIGDTPEEGIRDQAGRQVWRPGGMPGRQLQRMGGAGRSKGVMGGPAGKGQAQKALGGLMGVGGEGRWKRGAFRGFGSFNGGR